MEDIFVPIKENEKLNSLFCKVKDDEHFIPAKKMIESIAAGFQDVDGNFIEQFQTQGFEARLWELFLYKLFKVMSFEVLHKERPDFLIKKDDIEIYVEASTSNPDKDDKYQDYIIEKAIKENDYKIQNELIDYYTIKIGSVLYSKLCKKYWEIEEVQNKPIILAISPCHNLLSRFLPDYKIIEYLYGKWYKSIDNEVLSGEVTSHIYKKSNVKKEIPSCFFKQENSEYISAVLFTNNCDIYKFNRMGYELGYSDKDIIMIRSGLAFDKTSIDTPKTFCYLVNRNKQQENWKEGVVLFHNPNAKIKLPPLLFDDIKQVWINEEGKIDGVIPAFFPFTALTFC